MTNKKYNGKIYICKSCGRVHECDIRCPSCFGGKGHQNVIADTNDKERIAELEKQNAELQAENEQLKRQELTGMDCTIDQMLSIDLQEEWGLDKQDHGRNIQLMFVRAVDAINELEAEKERLRCCGNCAYKSGLSGFGKCSYHNVDCHGWDKTNEKHLKHWKRNEWKMNPTIGQKIVVRYGTCELTTIGHYIGASTRYGHEIIALDGKHVSFTEWRVNLASSWNVVV